MADDPSPPQSNELNSVMDSMITETRQKEVDLTEAPGRNSLESQIDSSPAALVNASRVNEHDKTLIDNWAAKVKDSDVWRTVQDHSTYSKVLHQIYRSKSSQVPCLIREKLPDQNISVLLSVLKTRDASLLQARDSIKESDDMAKLLLRFAATSSFESKAELLRVRDDIIGDIQTEAHMERIARQILVELTMNERHPVKVLLSHSDNTGQSLQEAASAFEQCRLGGKGPGSRSSGPKGMGNSERWMQTINGISDINARVRQTHRLLNLNRAIDQLSNLILTDQLRESEDSRFTDTAVRTSINNATEIANSYLLSLQMQSAELHQRLLANPLMREKQETA